MPIRDLCSYVCSAVLGDLHLADFVHGPGCNPWSDGKVHLTPLLRGRQAEGDLHLADFVHGPGCNPWSDGKVHLTPLLRPPLETLDRLPWIQPYRRLGQNFARLALASPSQGASGTSRTLRLRFVFLINKSFFFVNSSANRR